MIWLEKVINLLSRSWHYLLRLKKHLGIKIIFVDK